LQNLALKRKLLLRELLFKKNYSYDYIYNIWEKTMKKLLFVVIAMLTFNAAPLAFADDTLPEVPPVDDPVVPPIDAPAPDDAK
jgi:hypothetical protein